MNNFDNEKVHNLELAASVIQNAYDSVEGRCPEINKRRSTVSFIKRSLDHNLNCQK